MGAFFLVAKAAGLDAAVQREARELFAETGFGAPETLEGPGYSLDIYGKIGGDGPQFLRISENESIACVGTLIYRGRSGREALAALHAAPQPEDALPECIGHFVILIQRGDSLRILRDGAAAVEIFHEQAGRIFSTSLLAVARTLPDRRINAHGVYEYVFYGVNLGTDTPFAAIRRLDIPETIVADGTGLAVRDRPLTLLPPEKQTDEEGACTEMLGLLQHELRQAAEAFGGRVTQALSAGYDSRLMLAAFRSIGITPRLFVYGASQHEDVLVAKQIATSEGIPLEHVDKSWPDISSLSDQVPEMVARSFLENDGLTHGGAIWAGLETEARIDRHAEGALNVHGGGGEVLRKLYGLTNSPTTTTWVARCFYTVVDPTICTPLFSRAAYERRIDIKMQRLLGIPDARITRRQAETLYPHYRLRAWFGRDNGINLRYGHSLMPFLDFTYISRALALPVHVKRFGHLQARMIRTADPRIAAYPSGYGHNFSGKVPRRAAVMEALTVLRPPFVRRGMQAIKRARATAFIKDGLWEDRHLGQVIDLRFPIMAAFFDIEKIRKGSHFYPRIASLEYLFTAVGAGAITAGSEDLPAAA